MLTFEKIREAERNEREAKTLQKLPENFIEDLKDYLRKKERTEKTSSTIRALENVKNTIKSIFELREKKIMDLLLYTARTGNPIEGLEKGEEKIFFAIYDIFKSYREEFFSELQKEPQVPKESKVYYRVKKSTPAVIGPDMKTYELHENEILDEEHLPKPLNELLLKNGVIEKI